MLLHKKGGNNNNELSEKTIKDIISVLKSCIIEMVDIKQIKNFNLNFKLSKDNINKKVYILTNDEQNKIMKYVINNLKKYWHIIMFIYWS